jgi:hypothetical protein
MPGAPAGGGSYGFQDDNPGKPGTTARRASFRTRIAFDIPIEQRIRPGLTGRLRIETRP